MTDLQSDDFLGCLFDADVMALPTPAEKGFPAPAPSPAPVAVKAMEMRAPAAGVKAQASARPRRAAAGRSSVVVTKRKRSTMSATMDKKNKKEKLKRNAISQAFTALHGTVCPQLKISDKTGILEAALDEIRSLRLALKNAETAAWDLTLPIIESNPSILELTAQEIKTQAIQAIENEPSEPDIAMAA
mmetsp:Transcript_27572/g.56503  ORF Transcript_27572/g.56503 Transcript_27572/m.56503 type:complete len:188 (-) Transcript_27572:61-624(-)|eukprot:CAMPEP_0181326290 /NCGR_PEP_ID=MMETSP1101-20121128/21409_1 /TAXON_ID=46948 /ORGANISM="Rhodomonas abbreviata, Strain Caron Lab Isolate" /LENGTH=187 /DNA_ID=CAMNT_0023434713 /DNA_START=125 /DNA_END=688 /DNA_ORIENTATION=+